MAAVRQIHPEERVAGLEERRHRGVVRLRAGVRLHVRVIGAEQLLRAIDRQLFDLVDDLAAAVVALARKSFGVLVGERRAHGFEHGRRDEVLARDQLEPILLALRLLFDQRRDVGVGLAQRVAGRAQAVLRPIAHSRCRPGVSIFSTRRA